MAKGNLFLGTAAKSVGDVVMYRRDGAQVSRVRVRNVANPKTEAQCRQRAAFSPVAKFYAPLAVVLERAFEGLNKSKSYSAFLKANTLLAKSNEWFLPKGTGFFPLPYQLSQGTLQPFEFPSVLSSGEVSLAIGIGADDEATIGRLSEAFVANGYAVGDIVTIIAVSAYPDDDTPTSRFVPFAVQFVIDEASSVPLTSLNSGDINIDKDNTAITITCKNGSLAAAAVIVARYDNDKWRRSTQFLQVNSALMTAIAAADYKAAAIASYSNAAGAADPLVYLDGDELQD